MIRRDARQLKTSLERPHRIDRRQRYIAPMGLVEGFKRINASPLKLRPYQTIKQLGAKSVHAFGQNDSAISLFHAIELACQVTFNDRRSRTGDRQAYAFRVDIYEMELLPVWRILISFIKAFSHVTAPDHEKRLVRGRSSDEVSNPTPITKRHWDKDNEAHQ